MTSKHKNVTCISSVIIAEHKTVEEASGPNAGQAWVKANPHIVRMALAFYPYYGNTVLMTKKEFAEKGPPKQVKKVRERDFPA